MSLTIRVGDVMVTRLAEDLALSKSLHGHAACSFTYRAGITTQLFSPFEKVYVFSSTSADTVWEGRLEDSGRSVDGEGQQWSVGAVGELARAEDQAAALIYIDEDLSKWEQVETQSAPSASFGQGEVPSLTDTDGLVFQFNPGEPIPDPANIFAEYKGFDQANMEVGAITYSVVSGLTSANYQTRTRAKGGGDTTLHQNTATTVAANRAATLSTATAIPAGSNVLELAFRHIAGGATTIGTDTVWGAYYNIVVKGARYNLDGTTNTTNADYTTGRGVFPHEVVTDLLGRLLGDVYDAVNAEIDETSTHELDQFAYPDGATATQILEDLMALEPNWYWQVGATNPTTGLASFVWRKWPTHIRYEFSMVDGLDIPGAEAERYNRVTFRWVDKKDRVHTKTYNAGTTINGIAVPTVDVLDEHGLIRQPEIQDLSTEVGSEANADKAAAEFLLQHGTPPVSGTLTVARKVWDHDSGRFVQPYEIEPGHLGRIRELADDAADLGATDRDGKTVFRIMSMDYRHDTRSATVELDAPARTDEELLAQQIRKRNRKR